MIHTKKDLGDYLDADKKALCRCDTRPRLNDFVWKFQIALRHLEFYTNKNGGVLYRLKYAYWKIKYQLFSIICGFEIPVNCFGKGLSIAHRGTIVVNGNARIGDNCRLHTCVNIGTSPGASRLAPRIGNNVYIGPGVKIWGDIYIGNNVMIGANAAVGKDFPEGDCCIAGIPARIIKPKGRLEIENYYQSIQRQRRMHKT